MTRLPCTFVCTLALLMSAVVVETGDADSTDDGHAGRNTRTALQARVGPDFQTRAAFATKAEYGKYVEATLRFGWRVRACEDYQKVKKGMMGTYYGTNPGDPDALVIWDNDLKSVSVLLPEVPRELATHAYWVFWHHLEIVDGSLR